MAGTLFKNATYPVGELTAYIQRGTLALPDIQRPFVWEPTKVRDLLDSMYRGFPVGNLLLWDTGVEPGARQIGTDSHQSAARLLIVDGQQRLTSLYAVLTGKSVVTKDFKNLKIRIAFRPTDGTFRVCDAATERDPEYISDISLVWETGPNKAARKFLERLAGKRVIEEDEGDRLQDAVSHLHDLSNYIFHAVELSPNIDEEAVAEVFVRINSEGVTLNQSDFILTLMSVFWDKGRRELEQFARASRQPVTEGPSPFNWHIHPEPAQLLRVTIVLAFRRAVLKAVYAFLRGRDPRSGEVDPDRRVEQFARLERAQDQVLDLTNWHEFLTCLERAGFRSRRMISGQNAIVYSYALWLIGRTDYAVPLDKLREAIARWFFMAQITSRYSGSFETQMEADLAQLDGIAASDAEGFLHAVNKIVSETLTQDFWTIALPNNLSTSASGSPALYSYFAALNILDAQPLLSTSTIRSRTDPAVLAKRAVERHHLFPRAHLMARFGIKGYEATKSINQIANMALVEWSDNVKIGDRSPAEYWPEQVEDKNMSPEVLARHVYWHALPRNWHTLDYQDFLAQRRKLMAEVIRDAFSKLGENTYRPSYRPVEVNERTTEMTYVEPASHGVSLANLMDACLLTEGGALTPAFGDSDLTAALLRDGRIAIDENEYATPTAAAVAVGAHVDGWKFWLADTPNGQCTLHELRRRYTLGKQN